MTKFEFLGDLSRLIADLPQEEVEQAMEYYEDYFADAGPEKEQEIIKDFISPAYIAEQLREASLERQRMAAQSSMQEEERQANAAMAAAAAGKPAVFSRKQAAKAQKQAAVSTPQPSVAVPSQPMAPQPQGPASPQSSMPPQPQIPPQSGVSPQVQGSVAPQSSVPPKAQIPPQPNVSPQAQNPVSPQLSVPPTPQNGIPGGASPHPSAATGTVPQNGISQGSAPSGNVPKRSMPPGGMPTTPSEKKSSNMRNSIFRDDEDDKEKAEAELALRNKTKVDIKSINATTSKVDKKQARENAKRNAEEAKAYNAEMYSSSKKMIIGIVLLITCPIWLAIVAAILGLFVVGAGAVVAAALLGVASFGSSIASVLIAILSLLNAKIATCIFALGCVCFLFAAGVGLWFLSFKLVTRIIPSGYFNVIVLFTSVKAKLSRLALK